MSVSSTTEPQSGADVPAPVGLLTALAWFCGLLLGTFVLLLVGTFVYSAFHSSLLGSLRDADRLAVFLGNLLVVFYAFPAFIRTKDPAFFCVAAAALCFGYGGLFSILFGIGPPTTGTRHMSHLEAYWYYAGRYAISILGLVLYTYGLVTLARRAMPKA
jgi:hypothetical protein